MPFFDTIKYVTQSS